MKIACQNKRLGSVMVLATVGVLGIIFLGYVVMMRTLSGIGHQSHILFQKNISLNLAKDLAQLAGFIIQKRLTDKKDPLVDLLTRPMGKMKPYKKDFVFPPSYKNQIIYKIMEPLKRSMRIDVVSRKIEINPRDFYPYNKNFPANKQFEKTGVIKLHFRIKLGKKARTFVFNLPVDIVMPIPLMVKRFVLYAQEAYPKWGNDYSYNQIEQDQFGDIKGGNRPLVINSYPFTKNDLKSKLNKSFIFKNCGFIFLGSKKLSGTGKKTGDIHLNLGSGYSEAGEGNHLFVQNPGFPQAKNLYEDSKLSAGSNYYVRLRDAGFDTSEVQAFKANNSDDNIWLPSYVQSLEDKPDISCKSSAFKLFGIEKSKANPKDSFSPTLVIGPVYRRFVRASLYFHKNSIIRQAFGRPYALGCFFFPKDQAQYQKWISDPNLPNPLLSIASPAKSLKLGSDSSSYNKYRNNFASRVVSQPYNRSIDFVKTGGENADPPKILSSSNLYKKSPLQANSIAKFPRPDLSPGVIRLDINNLFRGGRIKKSKEKHYLEKRGSWIFSFKKFFKATGINMLNVLLKARGLMYGNVLNLKGVINVRTGNVVLKTPGSGKDSWELKSSGVIVTSGKKKSEGRDIFIKSGIKKDRNSNASLALVSLYGDIHIETDSEIDALLICPNGTIYYKNKKALKIYGGILVKTLFRKKSDFEQLIKNKGGLLEYDPTLAQPLDEATAKKMLLVSSALKPRRSYETQ
ncbi:hypothetical protein ACFL35_09665 [Candidatus Riflebacteria bacterium]